MRSIDASKPQRDTLAQSDGNRINHLAQPTSLGFLLCITAGYHGAIVRNYDGSILPRATEANQPLTVLGLVGTHEIFFPNLDTVVPKNVVRGCNVKEKLWHAVFQGVVFNS